MRRMFAFLVATVLVLSGCKGSTPNPQVSGGATHKVPLNRDPSTLVVAVDAFNADFDPASAYLLSEALIWRGVYESLIRLKGNSASEVEPLLADTWEANADKSSWTFHLHLGVTFSDGTPLDAQAVKTDYTRTIKLALGTQLILGSFITDPDQQIVVVQALTLRLDIGRRAPHFDIVMAAHYGT